MPKLTKRQLKEEFHKFLRENNCASKFYVNLYHPKATKWREEMQLAHDFEQRALSHAFAWYYTPQRKSYWLQMNCSWERKYKELTA